MGATNENRNTRWGSAYTLDCTGKSSHDCNNALQRLQLSWNVETPLVMLQENWSDGGHNHWSAAFGNERWWVVSWGHLLNHWADPTAERGSKPTLGATQHSPLEISESLHPPSIHQKTCSHGHAPSHPSPSKASAQYVWSTGELLLANYCYFWMWHLSTLSTESFCVVLVSQTHWRCRNLSGGPLGRRQSATLVLSATFEAFML